MQYLTSGESHGSELTVIINQIPSGIDVDIDLINNELKRRQAGYGRGGRMKIETDKAEIVSGVRFSKTTGAPVTIKIKNNDWLNWTEKMAVLKKYKIPKLTMPRPGHSDYAGLIKYNENDIRNILERSSARETAAQTAAGAFVKCSLKNFNIDILSHTISVGGIFSKTNYQINDIKKIYDDEILRCVDKTAEKKMIAFIDKAKKNGDTLGGILEVIITNVIPGLGSHIQYFNKLDAKLAAAVIAIQGIKGIEFGAGFAGVNKSGAAFHDEFDLLKNKKIIRKSNNAGGIEGGMSNGCNIVFRAAMKPIPTLMNALQSVDLKDLSLKKAIIERSDVCVLPAAGVVAEAVTSLTLFNAILEEFGYDNINLIKKRYFDKLKFIEKKYGFKF